MGLVGFESAPRYRELLYKLISEDLEFPPPGFTLESDRPEWSFLKDELRWVQQPLTSVNVAAQSSFVQLFNPLSSGRLVTVTTFCANPVATTNISEALTTTVRGATGGAFAIAADTRWDGFPPTVGLPARDSVSISAGALVPPFVNDQVLASFQAPIGIWTILPFPIVTLAPGSGVCLSSSILNTQIAIWTAGYSRQARPEELAP